VSDQISHPYKTTGNEAMITNVDKGNSVAILPIQHYDIKIQNFITENHSQTLNTHTKKTVQNQIIKTINHSKTLIRKDSR
jgi:hypothetical protein